MMKTPNAKNTILGIVGAGTMGSGIALAALFQGYQVVLQDAFPGALEKGQAYIEKFLAKKDLTANMELVTYTKELAALASADIVIEAVIEDLTIKQELFANLELICKPDTIFASNTSTLAVTAIASSVKDASRVAGIHFFNPAPILPLVEVVRAANSSDATIDSLVALAKDLGKTPVVTGDTPGFIVNRVARPFYGEALRLLGEGAASFEDIDLAVEQGAGFRMGPFRLMDLIGIDINATAMKSMYEQTFGEPRYRPHWIQMQKMQAGTLGRKTGYGFYRYPEPDVEDAVFGGLPKVDGQAVMLAEGEWGMGLREAMTTVGYSVGEVAPVGQNPVIAIVTKGRNENLKEHVQVLDAALEPNVPILVQAVDCTVTEICSWVEKPERIVGFDGLFFTSGNVATLVASHKFNLELKEQIELFCQSLGKQPIWVADTPALILPRILFMLINEAAFAVQDGVADADTVDLAMQLGVNYPKGLLVWGREIGLDKVVAGLDHLQDEYGEERYRSCALLRRWVRESVHS